MRHIVGLVCCIAMLGALLFLAAPLSAQPTGTPITAHTTLAVGQNGRIGSVACMGQTTGNSPPMWRFTPCVIPPTWTMNG